MVVLPYLVELWPVVFSAYAHARKNTAGSRDYMCIYMYYDLVGCQLCVIIELVLLIQRCHNYILSHLVTCTICIKA